MSSPRTWLEANRQTLDLPPDWGGGKRAVQRRYVSRLDIERSLDMFRRLTSPCTCGIFQLAMYGPHRKKPPFDPPDKCLRHGPAPA